ncbi:hypothetical protein [Croceicoccus sp. BE223]|uniref:hypothetical protein n=1 Tax=Croceicoccus sp. BE223 TaxID=2817716 RepID=UPI0028559348|nr:hypothetical protein [Croceicoccus sp. BE223]MDR7102606.1 hypothetical protein [Croceicoccus sp. BE223]
MSEAATEAAAPSEVRFEITPQQSVDAAQAAHARAVGRMSFLTWIPLGGALAGYVLGLTLEQTINAAMFFINPALGIVFMGLGSAVTTALALIGYAVGLRMWARSYHRRYLFGMYERGMPARTTVTFRLTDTMLEASNERMSYAIGWPFIAELVEAPTAWTVVADMTTFVVLKSAFADKDEERAFVQTMLERLSPAARERSAEARAFVAA